MSCSICETIFILGNSDRGGWKTSGKNAPSAFAIDFVVEVSFLGDKTHIVLVEYTRFFLFDIVHDDHVVMGVAYDIAKKGHVDME